MVTLTELAELPAGPPLLEPEPSARRALGLYLADPNALESFGFGGGEAGPGDPLALGRNLAQYVLSCGASAVVLPERLADRTRRRALDGQAAEDALGPDRLDLLLRVLGRHGCSAWVELALEETEACPASPPRARPRRLGAGPDPRRSPRPRRRTRLPPAPPRCPRGAEAAGRTGDRPPPEPAEPDRRSDPARPRPDSARRPRHRVRRCHLSPGSSARPSTPRPPGVSPGSTPPSPTGSPPAANSWPVRAGCPGSPGDRGASPRSTPSSPKRSERRLPAGCWRWSTPGLEDDPAGHEARRVDLAGLAPSHAWRAVGLDLETWPGGEAGPVVLRGAGLSTDALAHDLATSPELDALVAARPGRGLLLGVAEEDAHGESVAGQPHCRRWPAPIPTGNGNSNREPAQGYRVTALGLAPVRGARRRRAARPRGGGPRCPLGHTGAVGRGRARGTDPPLRTDLPPLPAAPAGESAAVDRQPFGVTVRTIAARRADVSGPGQRHALPDPARYPGQCPGRGPRRRPGPGDAAQARGHA